MPAYTPIAIAERRNKGGSICHGGGDLQIDPTTINNSDALVRSGSSDLFADPDLDAARDFFKAKSRAMVNKVSTAREAVKTLLQDGPTVVVRTGAPCAAAMLAQKTHSPNLTIMFEARGIHSPIALKSAVKCALLMSKGIRVKSSSPSEIPRE